MAKHTPGPWHRDVLFIRGSNGEYVADVELDPDDPVAIADANLIAAAPDLLEALKAAFSGFIELHGQNIGCPECPKDVDPDDAGDPRDCPAVHRIEAVISKAEGR